MTDAPTIRRFDTLEPRRNAHTLVFTTHERSEDSAEGQAVDPHAAFDDACARAMGRILHGHYQGHAWNVWVSRKAGIAKIWISLLMSPQTPYVLHLTDLLKPSDVMRAGGEILERYDIPRSTIDFSQVKAIRKARGPLGDRMMPPGGLGRLA